jgi:hypothetical protein
LRTAQVKLRFHAASADSSPAHLAFEVASKRTFESRWAM